MFKKRDRPVPAEAVKARDAAEQAKAYAQWQQENTRRLMDSIREIRLKNHFSEALNPRRENPS